MRKQTRSVLFYGSILLSAFILFACRFSVPSLGNKPGTTPLPTGAGPLPDPAVNLSSLNSYTVSFQQDVSGSLDGSPFERHTQVDLKRVSGEADFTRTIQGSLEVPSYFRAVQSGQAVYRWTSPEESCQGEKGSLQPGEILEPAGLLLPVTNAAKVGTEEVNGIASVHYHFDESALALAEPKPSVSGDLWLADPGGYVVKYTLDASKPSKTTGKGMEVGQTLSYELSQADAVDTLALPAGCMAVPLDLPVMADATGVIYASGMIGYGTASSASQVVDFYNQALVPDGWTPARAESVAETKLPLGLLYYQGDLNLSVNVDKAEAGGLDVNLVVFNPAQSSSGSSTAPEPTPTSTGPQPTIDASTSGLPDDVPLYPGSTSLQSLGGMGIGFTAPDSPDQVSAFYKDKLAAAGWTLFTENTSGGQITQVWQKDNRTASLVISTEDGKTSVLLMLTTQ